VGKSLNWRRARTAGIVVILTTIIVLVAQSQTLIDAQFSPQPQPAAKEAGVPLPPQTTKGKDRPDPEGESSVVVPKGTPANVAPRVTAPASTDLPNANFNETNPPANNNTPAGTSRKLLETLRKKGDLSLRDASLRQALFAISENWQVSIVVGPDIDGKVDGSFHDAPLFEILDSILTVNGFGYRATGNNLVVGRLEALAGENPLFETAILELASANPDDLINLARPQSSLQGRLEAFGNGGLLVADYPDNIRSVSSGTSCEGCRWGGSFAGQFRQ
jgi:hypothetical protein